MTLSTHIVAHHVGGRGLTVAFFVPPRFQDDVLNVLYEADADACAAAASEVATRKNFHLLPYALGAERAKKSFFVMANPYFSSLYRPNAAYADYYGEVELSGTLSGIDLKDRRYDTCYGSENRIAREIEIETHALDSLIAEGKVPAAAARPDLISLDTQGSELDILRGAKTTLRSSTLAVVTEISFHRLYDNQPLLSASLDLLDAAGFHFAGFSELFEISPYRAPVGLRGRGFTGFGDAVFLRRLETLPEIFSDPTALYVASRKLAFIALKHSFVEYALQALELGEQARKDADPTEVARFAERQFDLFLAEFLAAAASLRRRLHDSRSALLEALRREGHFYLERAEDGAEIVCLARVATDAPDLTSRSTQVEALLEGNGFERLALLLKTRREAARGSLAPEERHQPLRIVVDAPTAADSVRMIDYVLPAIAASDFLPAICTRYDCEVLVIAPSAEVRPIRQCLAAHAIRQHAPFKLVSRDGANDYGAAVWRAIGDLQQKLTATRLVLLDAGAVPTDGLLNAMLMQTEATGASVGAAADGVSIHAFKPSRNVSTLGAVNAADVVARVAAGSPATSLPAARVVIAPMEAKSRVQTWRNQGSATYWYRSHGCATLRVDLRAGPPARDQVAAVTGFHVTPRHPDSRIEVDCRLSCYAPEPTRLVILLYADEHPEPIATSVTAIEARRMTQARLVAELPANGDPRPRFLRAAVAIEGDAYVYLNGTDAAPVDGWESFTTVTDMVPEFVPYSIDEATARAAVSADRRGFRESAGRELFDLARADEFDAVLMIAGQSMVTNAGETPYTSRLAVGNLNIYDRQVYRSRDPLLGTSEDRGSVASRLGDILIERGIAKRVLLVPIGIGGTRMCEWAPGGGLFQRVVLAQHILAKRGIKPTHVLWAQGESDAGSETSRREWRDGFRAMVAGMRELGIDAPVFVARSTYCHQVRPNSAAILEAQLEVVDPAIGILAGPDTDTLGPELRFDGCHFSNEGLARAAVLWADCLESQRSSRLSAPEPSRPWRWLPAYLRPLAGRSAR